MQREVARLCRDGGIVIYFKLYTTTYIGNVKQSLSQLRWQLPLLKGAYINSLLQTLPLLEMPPLCKGRWLGFAVTEGLSFTLKLYAIVCIGNVKQSLSQLRWQLPLLKMPPLFKGRWLGFAVTEGLSFTLSNMLLSAFVMLSNPSVSFADSSLYSKCLPCAKGGGSALPWRWDCHLL